MKRSLVFLSLLVVSLTTFAQDLPNQDAPKIPKGINGSNEIRLNLLNSLLGSIDFQYERLFKDNSGLGITVGVGFGDLEPFNSIFNISPAYRIYFSRKKAAGFFVEGNAKLSYDKYYHNYYYNPGYNRERENEFRAGFGLAMGGKIVTKHGLVTSFKGGIGRFIVDNERDYDRVYPILEVAIGKRF